MSGNPSFGNGNGTGTGTAKRPPLRLERGLAIAVVSTLAGTGGLLEADRVWAQPSAASADPTEPDRPWFANTTAEQRQQARQLFLEGNRLLDLPDYVAAATKYQEAIAIWDNPGFHYNLAGVQYRLVQPVAAYKSLQQALRHGQAPLSPAEYRGAVELRKLLEQQLAHIEVVCDQPAVRVTLDGDFLFTGERRRREVVLPGPHQVTGRKQHHEPDIHELMLEPGETKTIRLRLRALSRIEYRRRWPRWLPYVVASASLPFFVGAAYFDRASTTRFDQFDVRYDELCPMGCRRGQVSDELQSLLDSAEQRQRFGFVAYAAAGAILVTGAVLVYMNREIGYEVGGESSAVDLTVVPSVLPDSIGVTAGVRF